MDNPTGFTGARKELILSLPSATLDLAIMEDPAVSSVSR